MVIQGERLTSEMKVVSLKRNVPSSFSFADLNSVKTIEKHLIICAQINVFIDGKYTIPGEVTEWLVDENVQKLLSEGHHGLDKLVTGYFIVVVFVTYV